MYSRFLTIKQHGSTLSWLQDKRSTAGITHATIGARAPEPSTTHSLISCKHLPLITLPSTGCCTQQHKNTNTNTSWLSSRHHTRTQPSSEHPCMPQRPQCPAACMCQVHTEMASTSTCPELGLSSSVRCQQQQAVEAQPESLLPHRQCLCRQLQRPQWSYNHQRLHSSHPDAWSSSGPLLAMPTKPSCY